MFITCFTVGAHITWYTTTRVSVDFIDTRGPILTWVTITFVCFWKVDIFIHNKVKRTHCFNLLQKSILSSYVYSLKKITNHNISWTCWIITGIHTVRNLFHIGYPGNLVDRYKSICSLHQHTWRYFDRDYCRIR